jgi:hypothetical protein
MSLDREGAGLTPEARGPDASDDVLGAQRLDVLV